MTLLQIAVHNTCLLLHQIAQTGSFIPHRTHGALKMHLRCILPGGTL